MDEGNAAKGHPPNCSTGTVLGCNRKHMKALVDAGIVVQGQRPGSTGSPAAYQPHKSYNPVNAHWISAGACCGSGLKDGKLTEDDEPTPLAREWALMQECIRDPWADFAGLPRLFRWPAYSG